MEELSLSKIVQMFNAWISLASEALVNWENYHRDICAEYFMKNPLELDGEEMYVEINESTFVWWKFNAGHQMQTQWVFSSIEKGQGRNSFSLQLKTDQLKHYSNNSTIYIMPWNKTKKKIYISDLKKVYNTMSNLCYNHLTVNNSVKSYF